MYNGKPIWKIVMILVFQIGLIFLTVSDLIGQKEPSVCFHCC